MAATIAYCAGRTGKQIYLKSNQVGHVENAGSSILTHYNAIDIDKREEDIWIVFPWEGFWKKNLKELK